MVAAGQLIAAGEDLVNPGQGWTEDAELVRSSSGGTNTPSMLRARLQRATELLRGDG